MNIKKRKKLEKKGWKVGSVEEFLQLSPEEMQYVELKISLSKIVQEKRQQKKLTQQQLANLMKSSQSRIAKMEAGDPSVSLDLLIRSLLVLGNSQKNIIRRLV